MARLVIASNSLVYIYGEYTYTQNKSNNTTTLNTKVILQCYGGGGGWDGFSGGVQIGGNYYNGSSKSINLSIAGTYTLYSRSDVLSHNADGKFPSGVGLQFNSGNAGVYSYSAHIYLNSVIPTIPRTSSISNNTSPSSRIDFGANVTFKISRASDSFTHDLTYVVNETTYTIGTGIATSKSYAFPTSLINLFTNTTTPNITVTCITKNGSETVGSSSIIVYLNIPSSYKPSCSLSVIDVGSVPSSWGIWLKSKSKFSVSISASGSAGSTISSYYSTANGGTYTSSSFATEVLKNSGNLSVTAYVKDSRGRQSDNISQTVNVVDYWKPSISNYSVDRCLADGTLDNDGTYGKISCTYSIAPCSNKNAKSLVVKFGSTIKTFVLGSYSGTVTATLNELFSGLTTNASHVFEFSIIDSFGSINYNFTVPPSYCLVSKLNGGKGISFGEVATEELFNVAMISRFKKKLIVDDEIAIYGNSYIQNELIADDIKCKNMFNLHGSYETYVNKSTITDNSIILPSSDGNGGYTKFLQKIEIDRDTTLSFTASNGYGYARLLLLPLDSNGNIMANLTIPDFTYNSYYNGYFKDYIDGYHTINLNIDSKIKYFRIGFVHLSATFSNIQIEKSAIATEYTPYKALSYTSGSNGNGHWIKFEDGVMICDNPFIEIPANLEYQEIKFPQEFIDRNISIAMTPFYSYYKGAVLTISKPQKSYFNIYPVTNAGAIPSQITTFSYIAIGRWK